MDKVKQIIIVQYNHESMMEEGTHIIRSRTEL